MTTERNLRRTVLPNGLIVLTERMDHLRSVAMGVWIKSGSRCEPAETNGISHFVEHMLFKGTRSRSAQHIAREMDSIGGNLDAFTGKETICFNVKSLADHVPIALDVLADLVLNPIFASADIERERGVILEEIKIDEDNPDVLVHELFTQNFWKDHPLGKPILGTTDTVGRLDQQKLFDYHGDRFHGGNMVFSAAGNLDHDQLRRRRRPASSPPSPAASRSSEMPAPEASARIVLRNKKVAGAGADLPRRARAAHHRRQPLRHPHPQHRARRRHELPPLPDHPRRARHGLLRLLRPQPLPRHRHPLHLRRHLRRQGPRGRRPHPGRVPQAQGDPARPTKNSPAPRTSSRATSSWAWKAPTPRMANLARQEMYFQQFFTVEEIIARVDAVDADQVQAMAQRLFDPDRIAVTLLGRLDGIKLNRASLVC